MDRAVRNVFVILDQTFGEKVDELVKTHAVWLCNSYLNRHAAEILWAEKTLLPDQLTLFDVSDAVSNEETFLDILDSVREHHPSWARLDVVGVGPTPAIVAALSECGNGVVEITATGFGYDRRLHTTSQNEV